MNRPVGGPAGFALDATVHPGAALAGATPTTDVAPTTSITATNDQAPRLPLPCRMWPSDSAPTSCAFSPTMPSQTDRKIVSLQHGGSKGCMSPRSCVAFSSLERHRGIPYRRLGETLLCAQIRTFLLGIAGAPIGSYGAVPPCEAQLTRSMLGANSLSRASRR